MERIVLRYWPKGLGVLLAAMLLAALLSFDLHDPTFANLRLPSGGVANWLNLPGALLGGSLLEAVGTSALAAPLLLLNWVLVGAKRPPLWRYAVWCVVLLVAASGLHALAVAALDPAPSAGPGLLDAGLAGWALVHWAGLTTGPWGAAALLAYMAGFATARVAYAPAVGLALRDGRVFAGWMLRTGWRRWGEGWRGLRHGAGNAHRVAGAAALGLTRGAGRGVSGGVRLALRPLFMAAAALAEWRSPSLGRIKSRAGTERRAAPQAAEAAGAALPAAADAAAGDGFDAWFEAPAQAAAPVPSGAPLRGAPPPWRRPLRSLEPDDGEAPAGRAASAPRVPPTPAGPAGAERPSAEPEVRPPELPPRESTAAEPADAADAGGYRFQQPEAEAAWRQRFQRYARNLDLDWEEQLWRKPEEGGGTDAEPADEAAPEPDG